MSEVHARSHEINKPLGQVKKVSRPYFYKKESGRAVFFRYLLFPIACFLYTLLTIITFPQGYVGALRSNNSKTKHQILIKHKFV